MDVSEMSAAWFTLSSDATRREQGQRCHWWRRDGNWTLEQPGSVKRRSTQAR